MAGKGVSPWNGVIDMKGKQGRCRRRRVPDAKESINKICKGYPQTKFHSNTDSYCEDTEESAATKLSTLITLAEALSVVKVENQ